MEFQGKKIPLAMLRINARFSCIVPQYGSFFMESKAFAGRSVYSSCYAYSIVLRMIFRFSEKKTGRGFFEKSIPKKDFFAESHVIKAGYVKLTAKEMLGK